MLDYAFYFADGALSLAKSLFADGGIVGNIVGGVSSAGVTAAGMQVLSKGNKALSLRLSHNHIKKQSDWHRARMGYYQFQQEQFDVRTSRHLVDCHIDQLKLLTENGMWMSGFAIACFVELPIPGTADSSVLGFYVMLLFAGAIGITVFLFTMCSVHSTLLIAWLCDHRRRREELSFSQRWTPTEEKTYQFCQLAFILGVFFFFILSVAVTFITSYDHPGRNTATLISGTILLCAASVIAPILHKEYRRCVVNDC